ncbi:hypothetical protein DA798_07680 [Lactobacillus sp. PFC-70]|nr:hypothetical protein DA798_07680 [Lactobacillus sp. PFC-70]
MAMFAILRLVIPINLSEKLANQKRFTDSCICEQTLIVMISIYLRFLGWPATRGRLNRSILHIEMIANLSNGVS